MASYSNKRPAASRWRFIIVIIISSVHRSIFSGIKNKKAPRSGGSVICYIILLFTISSLSAYYPDYY